LALRHTSDAIAQSLLSYSGLDVNATDQRGRTPLIVAAEQQRTALYESLLGFPGIDTNANVKADVILLLMEWPLFILLLGTAMKF
jgi:ankyrin repeat protein